MQLSEMIVNGLLTITYHVRSYQSQKHSDGFRLQINEVKVLFIFK